MFKLEFISPSGAIMPLTGNEKFKLTNVDGLTAASVELSSSTVASMDGDFVNNERTMPRGIVIDLTIERDVENVKRYILQYVKLKQKGVLRWTQNEREVWIEGIVETIEMPRFKQLCVMQITLYCSQPYWEDIEYLVQDISEVIDLHYFTNDADDMLYFTEEGAPLGEYDANRTKAFNNTGDVAIGIEIRIVALGKVVNPVIYNTAGEYIGVDMTLQANDEVVITTAKGHKNITLNGKKIVSKIRRGSTWLQLPTGEEEFTIDSDDDTTGNMYFTITYKQRYV